jgi:predicted nucleic-acid-binding protein
MIALDTNILVRFLVRDDPKQARKAKVLVDKLDEDEARAFVSDIVLCELVWVLASCYRFDRSQIVVALKKLVGARQLRFDSTDNVLRAINAYETSKGDFADYLIREHARAAGCETVVTFDKALHGHGSFAAP